MCIYRKFLNTARTYPFILICSLRMWLTLCLGSESYSFASPPLLSATRSCALRWFFLLPSDILSSPVRKRGFLAPYPPPLLCPRHMLSVSSSPCSQVWAPSVLVPGSWSSRNIFFLNSAAGFRASATTSPLQMIPRLKSYSDPVPGRTEIVIASPRL